MINIYISLFILLVLFYSTLIGIKNKRIHMITAWAVIITDFTLVLWLALGRNVLVKLTETFHWLLPVHILLALSCLVFYVIAARYGMKLANGDQSYRTKMKNISKVLLPLRSLVFITIVILKINA